MTNSAKINVQCIKFFFRVQCPSLSSQRRLAHLVRAVCEAIVTENEPINNQTCDLVRYFAAMDKINNNN